MSGFEGKTYVVSGAASGIGAALADLIAGQGGKVIGLDLQPGPHVAHRLDLSDAQSIAPLAEQISGPFDGLANVAGVPGTAPVPLIGAVNLFGTRLLTEALAPKLAPGGAIVNVSSISADKCDWLATDLLRLALSAPEDGARRLAERAQDGTDAYQIGKAALNLLTGQWAEAYAARNLRVNAVNPGPVQTPILKDFEASMGKDRIDAAAAIVGRHALPGEIASACAMLLSDQASWINGQVIKVDGGLHARRQAQQLQEATSWS